MLRVKSAQSKSHGNAMCFYFLCPPDPVEGDARQAHEHKFIVNMMAAPQADPGCNYAHDMVVASSVIRAGCLVSCFCPCCAQIYIRRKALHSNMANYRCCQGYMDGLVPFLQAGQCGEQSCPSVCLCLEVTCRLAEAELAFLCNGCAVSATRMLIMDRYSLQPDEWDNRIIVSVRWRKPRKIVPIPNKFCAQRCNNCIQIASIGCQCLAICIPRAGDLAQCMQCIAQCTYASTQGCMTAQVNVEMNHREDYRAMTSETMQRV
ncbi:TPA: hypothetical protein N0F65_001096 [Lagenidium giganteum]|uniref:Uncharacterized protein n=1 Tax=Lagenidium giganteum TaxID=4803 RepID=A0AAV2YIM1_9STRA|nr:TPA: hypothetical protein N0F65_001096 [Lagenidium giganteum]